MRRKYAAMFVRQFMQPWRLALLLLAALLQVAGCGQKNQGPAQAAPPPPEVSVIKAATSPVTLLEDYAAQTEAVEAVEIRSRVGGILERQAFKDGSPVKKGELLFVIDQQPFLTALSQSRANLAQAQASHLNSAQNLARLKPLMQTRAISQQDLDAAVAKERADAASVEAGKAQVRQAQLNLDYTTIRAPRDGMISRALIRPGGLVNASSTLLTTLYSVDPMYVSFTISEQKLNELQRHYNLRDARKRPDFKVKLIDGSDYKYGGKLDFVDAAVDPRNGTLPARLVVPNPEGYLRPGQFVRVIMPGQENPNAILIPQKAVQELQGKRSVYVIGPDNKAQYRDIVANARVGNNWVVEQGIKPGELVVVEGIAKVKPGAPVKPVPEGAAGNGDAKPAQQASDHKPQKAGS
ncbi:efflux RND transporter periplasmic adaptor subunit [Noviherbaspirillum massiliense]|uniref:efflux RND transporter periplasmic adaptor subunit n=1 Tax=Noviherbaspirillum massiliense TaxID=1465823 RepID=UPI0011DD81CE|nr:efflux RND transporter periplasmic adaptor subunit [Noviherbaspirillum massiliense]